MNKQPFLTSSPQNFKLRIVWSIDATNKLVAEFSNINWLPRIGETLVLPIEEADKSNSCQNWRKFRVFDIIHDFQHQVVRVLCSPVSPAKTPLSARTPKNGWENWEKAFASSETKVNIETPKHSCLECELSQIPETDLDEELEWLKAQLLNS